MVEFATIFNLYGFDKNKILKQNIKVTVHEYKQKIREVRYKLAFSNIIIN